MAACTYCKVRPVRTDAYGRCTFCGTPHAVSRPAQPVRVPLDPRKVRESFERIRNESDARHAEDGMPNTGPTDRRFRNGRWS